MPFRPHRAAAAAVLLLLLAGCGGDEADVAADLAPAPTIPAPTAAADPKADWLSALSTLCATLSSETSGLTYQASLSENQITPAEHRSIAERAKPATTAFDAAVEGLPAPPEAAPAKKAFDDFLAVQKQAYAQLDTAAAAGDQAALTKAYGVIQGQYASTPEGQALKAAGVPEKCGYRGTYPQA